MRPFVNKQRKIDATIICNKKAPMIFVIGAFSYLNYYEFQSLSSLPSLSLLPTDLACASSAFCNILFTSLESRRPPVASWLVGFGAFVEVFTSSAVAFVKNAFLFIWLVYKFYSL